MVKRLYQITEAMELMDIDSFVGVRSDGSIHTDLRFTPQMLIDFVNENSKVIYTATVGGATISDPFFDDNTISEIVTNNQAYIKGVNFDQVGGLGDITGIDISFYVGQVLIAKI